MRIIKILIAVIFIMFLIAGCSDNETKENIKPDIAAISLPSSSSTKETTEAYNSINDTYSGVTAEIVKGGILDKGFMIETDSASVSLISWDLGNSGHALTKGDEVLCLKFHVKNNCNEQMEIGNLFHVNTFIDGIEINGFGSDFYGDGRSFTVFTDTKLRSGAESDIYFCYECSIIDSHKIEIDVFDSNKLEDGIYFLSENVIGTFEFDIQ